MILSTHKWRLLLHGVSTESQKLTSVRQIRRDFSQTRIMTLIHVWLALEVFGGIFVLSRYFLDLSVGVGPFVIGLSRISSFFSCTELCEAFTFLMENIYV